MDLKTGEEAAKFAEASGRIGHSPASAVQWIIAFSKEDLKSLPSNRHEQLSYEIAHFSHFGFHGSGGLFRVTEGFTTTVDKFLSLPSDTEIEGLQQLVREHLTRIVQGNATEFSFSELRFYISKSRMQNRRGIRYFKGDVRDAFKYHFSQLLSLYANWIRLCEADDCPSPLYVASRHHQKTCPGGTCQSRLSTRKWRDKKKMKKEKQAKTSRKSG